jgi:hypothetical protein
MTARPGEILVPEDVAAALQLGPCAGQLLAYKIL